MDTTEQTPSPKRNLSIPINTRAVIVVLLVIIGIMLFLWKPWVDKNPGDRTISVKGETTVQAEPDEYRFSPSYRLKASTKKAALDRVKAKSTSVVEGLKKLGIEDKDIKTDSNGYDYYLAKGASNYTLQLSVTINNRSLAQKVQDYLIDTSPSGQVSPSVTFSEAKQKELSDQARAQAIQDARKRADQLASESDSKVTKVKEIKDDNNNFNAYRGGAENLQFGSASDQSSLSVQPGQDKLTYSVSVVYFVK